ncbi:MULTISPECIES: hypothetical protein [unclassified Streptomyces]|uniref:hypothetical protein n=1 Tax=unclassified Streptomyces TaxID=2593676 RepID=UPI001F503BB2|nr:MULTISPECIES: hypothetical protein [unclassified Streptomyces]
MPTPVITVDEDVPPLSFTVPESFFTLPLAAEPDERAELSDAFVRDLYSRGDESLWTPAAPFYATMAERLVLTGLSYSALGLFSTDDGGIVQCAFTAGAVQTDQTEPDVAAQGILVALSQDPHHDARWMDLPCGPAVSCVTMREVTISSELTADQEEKQLLTGQIQVHVPFPNGPYTAVFTLHTASTEYWNEFCDMIVSILQTVSFPAPASEDPASDGSVSAD